MKFLDIFNEIAKGNYALTDEAIYSSIDNRDEMIPLWGGNKHHRAYERMVSISAVTKKNTKITVFSGEGIIISLDGSAGSMTYKRDEKFALNHHAGFITPRSTAKKVVNLEYFALFFQNFYRSLSVSEGSKTLSLKQIYSEEFELPTYVVQNKIMKQVKPFVERIRALEHIKISLEGEIMSKQILQNSRKFQAKNIPISNVIGYLSGNSRLTEEFIYHSLQHEGKKYTVLSSATEERTMMGQVPMCSIANKPLKVFEGKEGLLVTRNGKAGRTRFLEKGDYTINDHAYILFVKNDCPYKIKLKWLSMQYKKDFLMYSSNSDNGTWNMTGFFRNTKIDIPSIKDQERLIDLWSMAETTIKKIEKIQNAFETLLSKEVII